MARKKYTALVLAIAVTVGSSVLPCSYVSAMDWGAVLGTAVNGIAVYQQLDKEVKKINDTEEGRQAYFRELKDQKGVCYDGYYQGMLDDIMTRLNDGIGASDDSIYEKPFLYFLNNDNTFNAACGLGRVMTINRGLFSISESTDEVAFVLAHEMGHGMKDHTLHGTMKKARTVISGAALASATGGTIAATLVTGAVVGQINNVKIGKKMEWEADNLAMDYAYAAGYNPGAGAALWQRVLEKQGEFKNNLVGEIFSPSDHPKHEERRDNYEKRLTTLSGKHVTIAKGADMVQVNGKDFTVPAPLSDMTSAERKYFVMGNLAAAYAHGEATAAAENVNGTVYLGKQAIMTPVDGDKSADELVKTLNEIK